MESMKLAELEVRLSRVGDLIQSSGKNLEQMLAISARHTVECKDCYLKEICTDHSSDGCEKRWLSYLELKEIK
jgi:hypothetical protein